MPTTKGSKKIEETKGSVVIAFADLGAGSDMSSYGISRIKVTKGQDVKTIEIPISTKGVQDIRDQFMKEAPRPPIKRKMLSKEEASALGLPRGHIINEPQDDDPIYREKMANHVRQMFQTVVGQAMTDELRTPKGDLIVGAKERGKHLRNNMGFTQIHFETIINDINNLETWNAEELDRFRTA